VPALVVRCHAVITAIPSCKCCADGSSVLFLSLASSAYCIVVFRRMAFDWSAHHRGRRSARWMEQSRWDCSSTLEVRRILGGPRVSVGDCFCCFCRDRRIDVSGGRLLVHLLGGAVGIVRYDEIGGTKETFDPMTANKVTGNELPPRLSGRCWAAIRGRSVRFSGTVGGGSSPLALETVRR